MTTMHTCIACGKTGTGKYCHNCGEPYAVKRISLKALLHDVFHFFTHLEKGFWYTLKMLAIQPGTMQRNYVEGIRSRHQKPFSLLFLCASANGLIRYWLFSYLGEESQANFFHQYLALAFVLEIPVFTLINWLLFYRSKYNYAETGAMQLYMFSLVLLAFTFTAFIKLIWHDFDTALIEFPLLLPYVAVTFVNFYREEKRWWVIVRALIWISLSFLLVQLVEDAIISHIQPAKH